MHSTALKGFIKGHIFAMHTLHMFTHHTHTHIHNIAETMLCVTADIWQQRCGRIDSVYYWLKKASSSPEAKVIQAAAGTFSYVCCQSSFHSATPWHTWLQRKIQLWLSWICVFLWTACICGWTNYKSLSAVALLHGCLDLNTFLCLICVHCEAR